MSGGIDPGCVKLGLTVVGGRIDAVRVASERPAVAGLLRGRDADQAVRLVPLLFALCGRAQGRAAELALAAARGGEQAAMLDAAIQREALRENLWRWLLDLPLLVGGSAMREEFVAALRWLEDGRRGELGGLLAGAGIADLVWRLAAMEDVTDVAPRLLSALDAAESLRHWPRLDAEFCSRPLWQGAAAETGALARAGGAGSSAPALASRWMARLRELRDWADGREKVGAPGTVSAAPVDSGVGRALVETARGLLMHEVVLDGGKIADYLIAAPTEWNFHPQGPLVAWLAGRDAADRDAVQGLAGRAVAALDPCVRWELEWL